MGRTDTKRERTSLPPSQDVEARKPVATGKRSSLHTTQNELKRRTVSEDEVRLRAYELYLKRGASPGNEIGDWLQAEQELRVN